MHEVFAPFGPLIYRANVQGDFLNFLLEHLNVMRNGEDAKHTLAGNIELQKFALYPQKEFISFVHPHITNYLNENYLRAEKIYSNTFSKRNFPTFINTGIISSTKKLNNGTIASS